MLKIDYSKVDEIIKGKKFGEFSGPGKIMPTPQEQEVFCTKDDGYRGCWHGQTYIDEVYGYKYSGGLGTYSCKHFPQAVYSPVANKTFFCWGGASKDFDGKPKSWDFCPDALYHMVSYYDHETGMVPRPTILLDKYCQDAHDNPVISIDDQGYIWVFSPSHGEWTTRSFIHKSTEPYSIDKFETVMESLFAYPQVYNVEGRGFVFMHTSYIENKGVRGLRVTTSPDGIEWSRSIDLAFYGQGHYQVTNVSGCTIGSAFDYHPHEGGLEYRTNLYYIQSDDMGKTWKTVDGKLLDVPLKSIQNPAMIYDYEKEGLKVYVKDLQFDKKGYPVILYLTSGGYENGPKNNPRQWKLAWWNGEKWEKSIVTFSDSNYDHGSLYIEPDGTYKIIGPTEPGPQLWNPGGEVAIWISCDQGRTWSKKKQITKDSIYNHTYVRRPINAHPDFYAFWADGHTREFSESRLYFSTKEGEVYKLPEDMDSEFAKPEILL